MMSWIFFFIMQGQEPYKGINEHGQQDRIVRRA